MDKTLLVEVDFEEGKKLLQALDNAKFPVTAAFWLFDENDDEWRYILASPIVQKRGPKEAYTKVQEILEQLSPHSSISLQQISIVSPHQNVVKLLRQVVRTGNEIDGIRFKGNTINNFLIRDAYIYRMQ